MLEMKTHFISNSLNADSNKDKAIDRFDEFRMCIILFYSFSDQLYMSGLTILPLLRGSLYFEE